MRRLLFSFIAVFLVYSHGNVLAQKNTEQERNKEIAAKFHELDPNDIDDILAIDFKGHSNEFNWNRDDHRENWSNNEAEDKIIFMVAENDMVAVKFTRVGEDGGVSVNMDMMQFMKLRNGKITEIWEMFDQNQYESQSE